ncbi:D-alanyl-D-alanine carboxypeptidase [Actinocorallia herbida]|uniref:D-alanyl-D-alanine carboxypeptidase n=1 Tax=Actinocorallia herbida TaxID=58109 RepID=A0A3N1D0Q5_9ACTN|nr:serine hydrolase domain-containing protein [Actinocorallia herbida]ROO86628.1 D-alanyl-D-alanine carboxypeptidase [Actinocorallia herbida]
MARGAGKRGAVAVAVALLLTAQGCGEENSSMKALQVLKSPTASPAPLDAATMARLDGAVKGVMREAKVPGVIVGFWRPGSDPYVRAFGIADKEENTAMSTDLHMRIGSVTKTFTVTAVLKLVDDGLMGLDDPISDYVGGVPNGDGITLRQLAEMRSGLYNYTEDPAWEKALEKDPRRAWTPRELLDHSFDHPPVFAPGERFQYSNTNTVLLGLAVEKASGRDLQDYLTTEVIEPAGLKDTTFPTNADIPNPHAHGYTAQDESGKVVDATDWDPSWAWAAGAMTSTLGDMKRWAPALAEGALLKPETQVERLNAPASGVPGLRYGLGIFDDHGWLGHNGSIPGYQTVVVQLPEEDATLVVLANTDVPHEGNEVSTLFAQAVTSIVTPEHVYTLPPSPVASPTATATSPTPTATESPTRTATPTRPATPIAPAPRTTPPTSPRTFETPTPATPPTTARPPVTPTVPASPGG